LSASVISAHQRPDQPGFAKAWPGLPLRRLLNVDRAGLRALSAACKFNRTNDKQNVLLESILCVGTGFGPVAFVAFGLTLRV